MNTRLFLKLGAPLLMLGLGAPGYTQRPPALVVQLADLEVAGGQVERFKAAAKENAEATLRNEPGARAFHAVSEKGDPSRIRVFEMYADAQAYQAHLHSAHFQKFRAATDPMITSRRLFDTVPVSLGAKPQLPPAPVVRVAELEIDPAQLDAYKAAVTEEIEASIRDEPGVLAIYSTALKDQPNKLRFFEIYADDAAYRQHIASPHFRKYVDITKSMITLRRLLETEPIFLGIQPATR
jgi:quinol monooxygenase YgiN